MCVERMHRLLMAAMITLAAGLVIAGSSFALVILFFMAGMLVTWAAVNFCPSSWLMKKFGMKTCGFKV